MADDDYPTDEVFENLSKSAPMISYEQMYALEKRCQEDGVDRRTLLTVMTQSGEQLYANCAKEPEAFFEALEHGADYLERQREFNEDFLTPAATRLMLALCAEVDWTAEDAPFSQEAFLSTCRKLNRDAPSET